MVELGWYWHRLRAMRPGEVAQHALRLGRRWIEAWRQPDWTAGQLSPAGPYPWLPEPEQEPAVVRQALQRDTEAILAGRWRAFGHLDLKVDDPPRWHCDYLAGRDLATRAPAARLNPRRLPDGADIKLIWELSRWYQVVRLALGAYVLNQPALATKVLAWLQDWTQRNPPFRGWNWTSALEAGLRLIQFSWIEALLSRRLQAATPAPAQAHAATLERLCRAILPPHVWFTWRNRSFGSSANNHLLGELAGLIVALSRWPALARWAVPLSRVQALWEQEVLAQFAEDGGNREQALNYHLFAWELCWQARGALAAAGCAVAPEVDECLRRAAQFYLRVQVPSDPWDYGDSDNGWVTPLFADDTQVVAEWYEWLADSPASPSLSYWWGPTRKRVGLSWPGPTHAAAWQVLQPSGYALWRDGCWALRLDLSPLGYLTPAAHGHADALHLSIWLNGVAMVVDPGTGCYLADRSLRTWLASAAAHNGPTTPACTMPRRLGPFLWRAHPPAPTVEKAQGRVLFARHLTPEGQACRTVQIGADGQGVEVQDTWAAAGGQRGGQKWTVRWQFAPDAQLEALASRRFRLQRRGVALVIEVDPAWTEVWAVTDPAQVQAADPDNPHAGQVSPAFRQTVWAPYLKLVFKAQGSRTGPEPRNAVRPGVERDGSGLEQGYPCVLRTRFIALKAK